MYKKIIIISGKKRGKYRSKKRGGYRKRRYY